MTAPLVSIVIPVLRDAVALARLLPTLEPNLEVEIIVVSGDASEPHVKPVTDRRDVCLLSSRPGRGHQMNVGALAAHGRWFVFLHADTRLPPRWLDEIRRADADPVVIGGSFRLRLDSNAWQARVIERGVRWRVRCLDLAYGDQALFVRRDAFHTVGGYREWPLMEDVALVRDLRRVGRLYHSPLPVRTSPRRWERDGWWRRSARNLMLQLLFLAGASPEWLATRYDRASGGSARAAVVVMARTPSDSRGKLRLTRRLSGDHIELRRAMLLDTIDAVRHVERAALFIAVEPADALDQVQTLVGGAARVFPQRGETLGDRMRNAFAMLFQEGYARIVVIGSDLPTVPAAFLQQALDCLGARRNAMVVGPAADGGYYLIGLRAPSPELFDAIPWSTPHVLAATLEVARQLRLSVSLMPTWYDVDDPRDLRRVARETTGATRTRAWIAAHDEANPLLAVQD